MKRSPRRALAPLVLLAAVLSACGEDPPRETTLSVKDPAARWRRAADVGRGGDTAVIEALRPCRATFAWRVGSATEGRETLDLAPGEALRLTVGGEPSRTPDPQPAPDAERAKGRTRPNAYTLRYALDASGDRVRTDLVWTRDREPWSRIVPATVPPSWFDLPSGVEFPLIALGVSDVADATGLRLDLTSPPRIASPRPFAADDLVRVVSLVLTIEPR